MLFRAAPASLLGVNSLPLPLYILIIYNPFKHALYLQILRSIWHGIPWIVLFQRMESSSLEEILSSPSPGRSSPAENGNEGTRTSKLNNGYCADENDNEVKRFFGLEIE